MTITVGTDTYATVAEADTYASFRAWTDWDALTDAQKEARLVEAARYLDTSYEWKGYITSITQAMAWPRSGIVDKEGRTVSTSTVPQAVKDAQIELARLGSSSLVTSQTTGDVSSVQAGSVSVTFKGGQQVSEAQRFRPIDRILTGLYERRSGSMKTRRLVRV